MNTYCEGKVAVVTGAGGTLCSAIAKDLARQGAKVVLIGRTREKLEKVVEEIGRAACPRPPQFASSPPTSPTRRRCWRLLTALPPSGALAASS